MPHPILYSLDLSPPCRAVLITAKVINLKLEIREINLLKKEQMKDAYLKINPQHSIPTLDDNGFICWDSHAIIRYLVAKYAKDDSLYPKDLQKRATIDQRLHFEGEMLFATLRRTVRPMFFGGQKAPLEENLNLVREALDIFNKLLEGKKWLVGDTYTLADISCISTVCCMPVLLAIDSYPNVVQWLKTCDNEIPGLAEVNKIGVTGFEEAIKNLMQK